MSGIKFTVVVHEPRDVKGKITFATSMRLSLTGNTYYPVANPPLTVFDGHIKSASDSEAATKTTPPTNTVTERDGFIITMDGDIETYRLACQGLVNAATSEILAHQIAESFNMELKTFHPQGKREDELLDSPLPLTVVYKMKGTGPHEVETSPDNGVTIISLGATRRGEKQISGLTLKQTMYYRNRQVLTHDQYSAWTGWLPFTPTK
jgi:hypothetical protein